MEACFQQIFDDAKVFYLYECVRKILDNVLLYRVLQPYVLHHLDQRTKTYKESVTTYRHLQLQWSMLVQLLKAFWDCLCRYHNL